MTTKEFKMPETPLCKKGYGSHDYAVWNTNTKVFTCINCGLEKPSACEREKVKGSEARNTAKRCLDSAVPSPSQEAEKICKCGHSAWYHDLRGCHCKKCKNEVCPYEWTEQEAEKTNVKEVVSIKQSTKLFSLRLAEAVEQEAEKTQSNAYKELLKHYNGLIPFCVKWAIDDAIKQKDVEWRGRIKKARDNYKETYERSKQASSLVAINVLNKLLGGQKNGD
jgi:hypothetical protein